MPGTLIHGGMLVDVERRASTATDLLIRDGVIADIGEPGAVPMGSDDERYDATGMFVAPGFVDIHTHVFDHGLFRTTRLAADRVGVEQGVACLVDAGSAGAVTIDAFPRVVHQSQATPVFALVNIGSPGLPNLGGGHSSRPELVSLEATVRAIERHRGWVRGVKVQASASHTGDFGMTAVRLARKAAELTGLPLMAHIGNAPPVLDDVLDLLRPGDIVTHAYHGKVGGALTFGDRVLPALHAAVERGVVIDIGHGRSSFSFATCERALAEGLPVHTISTDIHRGNLDRHVVSLARTMSKLMLLGLTLEEVVAAVTIEPARALRLDADGFGRLDVSQPAHVTVFRVREEPIALEDSEGEVRTAPRWIDPQSVFVRGERYDRTAAV
ncbi:MAG: amidohydrolase family protein [Chloroflexi bacterium]|nr:amidohydrolase family protein [Chloroflexota bacterium]